MRVPTRLEISTLRRASSDGVRSVDGIDGDVFEDWATTGEFWSSTPTSLGPE